MRQCMVVAIWVQKAAGGLLGFVAGDLAPCGASDLNQCARALSRAAFTDGFIRSFPFRFAVVELPLKRYRIGRFLSMN
jgi:hypothetical protein